MAIRKRGKNGYYHAYFRKLISSPDGTLRRIVTTVNLYTTDLREAKALEAELMEKNQKVRNHQRALAVMRRMEVDAGIRPVEDLPKPAAQEKRRKRLLISEALNICDKYRDIGSTAKQHFRRFAKMVKARYMDEISEDIACEVLSQLCPDDKTSGKSFNNLKAALNTVFRLTLLDSGMAESPFHRIPNRRSSPDHQRPFTEDEFCRIYSAAPEPWKSAVLIAWFTGLREKDVFLLRWDHIDGDVITLIPAKTSRYSRAVQIPIHPQLMEALQALPRVDGRVLGNWPYKPTSDSFTSGFGKILKSLGIQRNEFGKVNFNSLRNSFITRCDELGVARHAIQGIVGHRHESMTNLYSRDLTSARQIQNLPFVKLGELAKKE